MRRQKYLGIAVVVLCVIAVATGCATAPIPMEQIKAKEGQRLVYFFLEAGQGSNLSSIVDPADVEKIINKGGVYCSYWGHSSQWWYNFYLKQDVYIGRVDGWVGPTEGWTGCAFSIPNDINTVLAGTYFRSEFIGHGMINVFTIPLRSAPVQAYVFTIGRPDKEMVMRVTTDEKEIADLYTQITDAYYRGDCQYMIK